MKGHSEAAALVGDAVDAQLIGHVCHIIFFMNSLRDHAHRLLSLALGEIISRLSQIAVEDFHQAVGIAVVVDRAALARRPDKNELFSSVRGKVNNHRGGFGLLRVASTPTYQVALPIPFVD